MGKKLGQRLIQTIWAADGSVAGGEGEYEVGRGELGGIEMRMKMVVTAQYNDDCGVYRTVQVAGQPVKHNWPRTDHRSSNVLLVARIGQ